MVGQAHRMSLRRCYAFFIKESIQVFRDPSSFLIAFFLPLLLLFLYGYGMSLDANCIRIGVAMEETTPEARSLLAAFSGSKYFDVTMSTDRHYLIDKLIRSDLRGVVVIPQDFSQEIRRQLYEGYLGKNSELKIQVIADGSETNTASFVQNYAEGVIFQWVAQFQAASKNVVNPPIVVESRTWFNPALKTRYVLLSGSIAITMTLIGIVLTALVVAREWEVGTMEALMATPIRIEELILGKLIPYFLLGICSMIICVIVSTIYFEVPFRGSYIILFLATSVFLFSALGIGLLISSAAKDQFVATQYSIMAAFLPAFMLSGFIFLISSMPFIIQLVTYILPARYFVPILQTLYLAGNVWELIIFNVSCLIIISFFLFWQIKRKIRKILE